MERLAAILGHSKPPSLDERFELPPKPTGRMIPVDLLSDDDD